MATVKTSWAQYYGEHKALGSFEPPKVEIHSAERVPGANQVKKTTVDDYHGPRDGVWYPDKLSPVMMWKGGAYSGDTMPKCAFFNPFARPSDPNVLVDYHTELLPGDNGRSLQWSMPLYATVPATRGNQALAMQHQKPAWLDKPAFLCFGSLRAFPLRQLRGLCAALHDRLLPLDHPCVQTMLRQLLYHTGDVRFNDTGHPRYLWKQDVSLCGLLPALYAELDAAWREVAEAPRNHAKVVPLAELASYFTQFDDDAACGFRAVTRGLAAAVDRWATDLEERARDAEAAHAFEIRAKQCLFRMYAVLCQRRGPLSRADAIMLCRLAVQVA